MVHAMPVSQNGAQDLAIPIILKIYNKNIVISKPELLIFQ